MPNQHTDGPGPLAEQHRDQILAKLAQGKRLYEIAPELGLSSPNSISKVLKDDPAYREAIESGWESKLDSVEQKIESAVDQVDVSRARALWSAYSWRAGVEVPHRWGQKQQVLNLTLISADSAFAGAAASLLDQLRTVSTQSAQSDPK